MADSKQLSKEKFGKIPCLILEKTRMLKKLSSNDPGLGNSTTFRAVLSIYLFDEFFVSFAFSKYLGGIFF